MSWLRETQIDAILGEEFDELLVQLGVRDDFIAGKYHCQICDKQVDAENVLLVLPLPEQRVGFVCRRPECLATYTAQK